MPAINTSALIKLLEQNKNAAAQKEVARLFKRHAAPATSGPALANLAAVAAAIHGAVSQNYQAKLAKSIALLKKINTLEAGVQEKLKINGVKSAIDDMP